MKLEQTVIEMIENADAKALATCCNNEVNVVPVSTVKVVHDTIWLMNYFMGQTLANVCDNPHVALACWKGLQGVKIKATVDHVTEGSIFEEAKTWVAEVAPIRTLKSVLVLTPIAVYDLAPVENHAGRHIQ